LRGLSIGQQAQLFEAGTGASDRGGRWVAIRITCIMKSGGYHEDPHHAISELGWRNDSTSATGRSSRQAIFEWIKTGGEAYVIGVTGMIATVGCRQHANGVQYLQTYSDRVWNDNLLALPEC